MPRSRALERRPSFIRLCASMIRNRLRVAGERLFRHRQWNIGVLRAPAPALLTAEAYEDREIKWFPLDGRKGFLADPFAVIQGDTVRLLCEYFDFRKGRGHICALDFKNDRFTQDFEPVIALPTHMSYPCLFEEAGATYCVPETCQANEVALYRAVEFPRKWSKVAVLVEHFSGVDATVFRHDGRWWLMCTNSGRDADVKLWVWHAADLLGPWMPHALNPVKIDVRGARPGGRPFLHDGALYRPTQDCSRMYGWRIVIQRVNRLTPTDFAEEPVVGLEASADSPFPVGRHTLTPVGDMVLIDGSRTVFVWSAFWWFLRIWANDLARKVRNYPGRQT